MVAFLRTSPTAAAAAASGLPISVAISATSSFPLKLRLPTVSSNKSHPFSFSTPRSSLPILCLSPLPPRSAIHMDNLAVLDLKSEEMKNDMLPEMLTEFMVDMKCKGCVSAVMNKLDTLDGVKKIDVDLENQVVKILGSLPVKTMADALEQTGRRARLIGQGCPEDFLVSAAVAEFKGPVIFGVVRLAQVNMELARIEASFTGLSPGKHALIINEFGDLTRGVISTGKEFNPPLGDLGTLEVQENGEVQFSSAKEKLKVSDLIGRSIVVYETEDKTDRGIVAAVIARSAGVGENYKKLCTCDGVTIWESS